MQNAASAPDDFPVTCEAWRQAPPSNAPQSSALSSLFQVVKIFPFRETKPPQSTRRLLYLIKSEIPSNVKLQPDFRNMKMHTLKSIKYGKFLSMGPAGEEKF